MYFFETRIQKLLVNWLKDKTILRLYIEPLVIEIAMPLLQGIVVH